MKGVCSRQVTTESDRSPCHRAQSPGRGERSLSAHHCNGPGVQRGPGAQRQDVGHLTALTERSPSLGEEVQRQVSVGELTLTVAALQTIGVLYHKSASAAVSVCTRESASTMESTHQ